MNRKFTLCRPAKGTVSKRHRILTVTYHQMAIKVKQITISLFPDEIIAKLETKLSTLIKSSKRSS